MDSKEEKGRRKRTRGSGGAAYRLLFRGFGGVLLVVVSGGNA